MNLMNNSGSNQSNCSCQINPVDTLSRQLESFLVPGIGCMGLLSNLIAILVLRSPQLKSTFHQSLLTLAICDILFLLFILGDIVIDVNHVFYIYMFPYFWNPLKNIAMSWETFLIMSIASERFLAVCRPLLYRKRSLRTSSFIHLLTFILPGLLFAIIINVPKFFEVELVFEGGKVDFRMTDLRKDINYIYYYTHWTRLLATGIIPLVFLVTTNTMVIIKVKEGKIESFKLRQQLQRNPRLQNERKPTSTYLSLALTGIVLVYIICNLPRLILNMVEYSLLSEIYTLDDCGCTKAPWWISSFIRSSHLLLTVNCSVNFFIYISFSKRFKKVFKIKIDVVLHKLRNCLG